MGRHPDDFGRIAAQTAKQVILQRIREAERDLKYEEYAGREGDIVTGIVQQTDNRYTLLDLGKVEALLPQAEQVPYERYEHGARLKAYIVEVRKTTKGPQIVVSRSHPGLVKRLFELEVPEISSGVVEIKAAAREPGHRTKIAVWSNDPNVDPVGACVGARGSRVRMVTNELRGERIDVVPFSDDPVEFIQAALQPARVREVRLDDETGTATVVVSDYQLSLAIGKEGQNARLAARLTGWRIDIKSETQLAEEEAGYGEEWAEGEWVENEAGEMVLAARRGRRGGVGRGVVTCRRRARTPGGASPARRPPPRADEPEERKPDGDRRRSRRRARRADEPDAADEPSEPGEPESDRIAPRRTCVGCRRAAAPTELVRVVEAPRTEHWRSARARAGCMAVPGLAGLPRTGGSSAGVRAGPACRSRARGGRTAPVELLEAVRRPARWWPMCARMVGRAGYPVRAQTNKKDRRSRCRRRSASTSWHVSSA